MPITRPSSGDPHRTGGRHSTRTAAVAVLAVVVTLTGACADEAAQRAASPMQPLRPPGAGVTTTATPSHTNPVRPPPVAEGGPGADAPTPQTAPAAAAPPDRAEDEALRAVRTSLARYDAALTEIARDPLGATMTGDPRLAAWTAVTSPSSSLNSDVLRRLVTDASTGMTIDPGPHQFSWRHSALSAAAAHQGRIAFTWCGWSPGVGRGPDGSVLDDGVRISEGTGELALIDGSWRLDQLVELDAEVTAPNTADPCPA